MEGSATAHVSHPLPPSPFSVRSSDLSPAAAHTIDGRHCKVRLIVCLDVGDLLLYPPRWVHRCHVAKAAATTLAPHRRLSRSDREECLWRKGHSWMPVARAAQEKGDFPRAGATGLLANTAGSDTVDAAATVVVVVVVVSSSTSLNGSHGPCRIPPTPTHHKRIELWHGSCVCVCPMPSCLAVPLFIVSQPVWSRVSYTLSSVGSI